MRALKVLLGIIAAVLVTALLAIVVMTQTSWGHERVRRIALGAVANAAHGIVRAGKLSGNLLTGITIEDLSITDSANRPFLSADSAQLRYRLVDFARKRIAFSDVRLVRPVIVLDERGGKWNYERIFPGDTLATVDSLPGFGDWISVDDLTIVDGRVQVRTEWQPTGGTQAVRDSVLRAALAGDGRYRVERIPEGYQRVMQLLALDAELPRLRIADPDSATMVFEVERMKTTAEIFAPPAAEVRDLAGTIWVAKDSLWFDSIDLALPSSKLTGSGMYSLRDTLALRKGDMALRLRGAPVAVADLRWLYPRLPSRGEGTLDFAMLVRGDTTDFAAKGARLTIADAKVEGDFGLRMSDELEFHDTNLRFASVDTRLIEQLAPTLDIPRRGTLGGRAAVAGTLSALRVDTDLSFADAADGTSNVAAVGELGVANNAFRARDLRIAMRPLQVMLVRTASPKLPLSGTIRGNATLNGSTATRLLARADVVHTDGGARSHLIGNGTIAFSGERWMDVDVRALPLSLATVGRFAPAAGLHGAAVGDISVRGPFRNLAVHADLRLPDGGVFLTDGRLDIASAEPGYDLTTTLRVFNLRSVTTRGPRTNLTALLSARGRGFDPATMRASLAADVSRSEIDSVGFDSLHVRVVAADGMASIDSLDVRTPFASIHADGTLGLAAHRRGELGYSVQIDSLQGLRRWLGVEDTTLVQPRSGRVADALRQARRDSAQVAQATEVERLATGSAPPVLRADTAGMAIRRDTLAGRVYAAGMMRGSIRAFELRGRAAIENLLYGGNAVRRGRLEYALTGGGTPAMSIAAGGELGSVQAAGFALDSVDARIFFQRPRGTVELAIVQDTSRDYRVRADFAFHPDHSELHLNRVALRFDTTLWQSARAGTIRWGRQGLEVETLDLRGGPEGRIYVDGRLPSSGAAANLQLAISGLEVGHITQLLQSDVPLTGVLALQTRVEGTQANPRFRGALGLSNPVYGGTAVPDVATTFQYADATLATDARFQRAGGAPVLTARASLPVNLALSGVTGPRVLERPMTVDVRADSMPLDVLPKFTESVSEVRGRLIGVIAARGTPKHPSLAGAAALDFASFRVVPMGVTLRDLHGVLRMRGDTLVIDSLVGRASGGTVKIMGGLATADITRPGFDLHLLADNALVMDTETGRIRSDADIKVEGPFDDVRVTGHASINQGVIWIPEASNREVIAAGDPAVFSVVDTSVVAERELLPAQSPLMRNMRVDVALHISHDTWVRGRDANVEIYTPDDARHDQDLQISVNRRRSALSIEGRVNTDRGEYTFLGRRFVLRQGSATFIGDPEINPLLQVTGIHEVRLPGREALEIRVVIGGTLRNPKIALESSTQPPISQSDLLSYLAFGQSSSGLLQVEGSSLSGPGTSSGNLVGNVAGLATRQLAAVAVGVAANEAERDLGRSLGADVVNIAPADVPAEISGSSFEALLSGTEIEVGRYFDRRTFVALNARPAAAVHGIRVAHRMARGFRIEASYESRVLLTEPTLSRDVNLRQVRVFGGFLIREWRF